MTLESLKSQILAAFPEPDRVDKNVLINLCLTVARIAGYAYEDGYDRRGDGFEMDFPYTAIRHKLLEERDRI